MRNHNLLIIDDDDALNRLLEEYLGKFGHRLTCATTAVEGLRALQQQPDLLILDIMLPDQDGLSLCREIRREHDLPIIMLTARGDVTDRIVGLELGADDYLAKPFEPRELVARIDSVLRRASERRSLGRRSDRQIVASGDLCLEPERRTASLAGRELDLTSTEFDLLHIFMQSRGVVLSRDQLLLKLRGIDADVYDRSIDMLVSRLRQKLGDDSRSPRFIKTVWRTGYQFVGRLNDDT